MKIKETTLCYIENGKGEYLMLHRNKKKNDENEDKWIGVGGKLEEGETVEDCVLREVREETGLQLTDYRYRALIDFSSDQWPRELMHVYTATGYEGALKSDCDEGELAWIAKKELRKKKLWEGDKLFLALLEANADFFELELGYRGEALVKAVLNGEEVIV